jgi:hypothetical protein
MTLLTPAQESYIVNLLPVVGKAKYHELKNELGIEIFAKREARR